MPPRQVDPRRIRMQRLTAGLSQEELGSRMDVSEVADVSAGQLPTTRFARRPRLGVRGRCPAIQRYPAGTENLLSPD
jgi:transcriptional regulator with XRE-family HTH domain